MGGTKGEVEYAVRRAQNIFDKWNETTGFVAKLSGYYYEIMSCIEDAVHCGVQAGLGVEEPLDSESEKEEENLGERAQETGVAIGSIGCPHREN